MVRQRLRRQSNEIKIRPGCRQLQFPHRCYRQRIDQRVGRFQREIEIGHSVAIAFTSFKSAAAIREIAIDCDRMPVPSKQMVTDT